VTGSQLGTRLMVVSGVVIGATLVAAFLVMGAPATQRQRQMDARRIADLTQIQRAVEAHHREHGALPADLAVLAARPGVGLAIVDPDDGRGYAYRAESAKAYSLCARFRTDSGESVDAGRWRGAGWSDPDWAHGRGETCFRRRIER
jgi:hypothetical protein